MPNDSQPDTGGATTPPATPTCEHPGAHHSDDVVTVWHGELAPMYLCGYHASTLGPYTYDVVRKARANAQLPPDPDYLCSNHDDGRPAIEVHGIPDGRVGYCADCAPMMRPYAHVVWSVDLARTLGIKPTL